MTDFGAFSTGLKSRLSAEVRIVRSEETLTRWDESSAPSPIATVFPRCENDVAEIVKYCRENDLKCFAQTGGHGWRVRNYRDINVIINLRGLNSVKVDEGTQRITLGGGALVKELIDEAAANKLEVVTGICNSVGAMGSLLYGGIGRFIGKYGVGVDNLLSVNLVDANGKLHENVNAESNPELWWAICGAGASFGIVTEATIQGHPESNGGMSWTGVLVFGDMSKLEKVVQTLNDMELDENMCAHFMFACVPPTLAPVIMIFPWYCGSEEEAEKVWRPLLDLEPTMKDTFMAPANKLNEGNDPFGEMGGRKPGVGLGLDRLDPDAYRKIWNLYVDFMKENPDAGRSVILAECYPKAKARSVNSESMVFANREINFEVICAPWYTDEKLDIRADSFSQSVRNIWVQKCCKPEKVQSYAAFAGIHEPLESLYGERERVQKLLMIKRKWDPENYWGALMDLE